MSHLETPFHPGPFHHQQPQAQQTQQQQQQHPYAAASPAQFAGPAAPPQQAFSPAPYQGAPPSLSRPPPPPFNDGLMQHQQQPPQFSPAAPFAGQQSPFTSAPFAQSVTSTSATPTPPLQQPGVRHSASPQQINSPYAGPQHHFQQQQQAQPPKQQTPPTKYPMAAPPLPQTPANFQHGGGNAGASPSAPQSPGTQAREQKRVEMLLDINSELLQEINNLQAQGRGGAMNPQHQLQLRALNMDESMAAEEYIQCLRRVQANLAYLAPRADTQQAAKAPPGPAHMSPPAHMPQLQAKYDQLRELFPGWTGYDNRMAQQQAANSPRNNSMNGGMNPQAQAQNPMAQPSS